MLLFAKSISIFGELTKLSSKSEQQVGALQTEKDRKRGERRRDRQEWSVYKKVFKLARRTLFLFSVLYYSIAAAAKVGLV